MIDLGRIGIRWVSSVAALLVIVGVGVVEAAPLGVPAATTGAGKTALGAEVNAMFDRDLTGGVSEAESTQVFAKGSIGIDDRLDVEFRLGFGDVSIDPGGFDTDIGPAFGVGFKTTWARLPDAHLKIGSVVQTMRIRSDANNGIRTGWSEYDAALGAVFDVTGAADPKNRQPEFSLMPYGGFAWSGVDLDAAGGAVEDQSFGLFLGLGAKLQGNLRLGAEVRLVDQTALSVSGGVVF
jgi:hypothetical protein